MGYGICDLINTPHLPVISTNAKETQEPHSVLTNHLVRLKMERKHIPLLITTRARALQEC